MNFSSPTPHQKIYLLGACCLLFVVVVALAKNGTFHQHKIVYSVLSASSSTSTALSSKSLISSNLKNIIDNKKNTLVKPVTVVDTGSSLKSLTSTSTISASSYLVGNAATGQVYLSQNPTMVNGLASISKLFTAIVVQENMDPNEVVQITPAMLAVYPNSYGIQLGEKYTVADLLYAMLLQSNDNVAEGLAMAYTSSSTYISAPAGTNPSESTFIQKMNALAVSLGLTQTHFEDASGLDAGNVSDAEDLFSFAQYLYRKQQNILGITSTYSYAVATSTDHLGHNFINIDPFVGDPHYLGGKTGRTDLAGETMLSIFNYESKGVNYPVVVIVLHSDISERQNDTSQLYLRAIHIIENQGS